MSLIASIRAKDVAAVQAALRDSATHYSSNCSDVLKPKLPMFEALRQASLNADNSNCQAIVQAMLDAGVDVNYVDAVNGNSVISLATEMAIFECSRAGEEGSKKVRNEIAFLEKLVNVHHASLNPIAGRSPLNLAVQAKATPVVRLLLGLGADPAHADKWGKTPSSDDAAIQALLDDARRFHTPKKAEGASAAAASSASTAVGGASAGSGGAQVASVMAGGTSVTPLAPSTLSF